MFEIATTQQTMSSREIAELTGKDASHIHRDIRSMLDELKDDPELDHIREDKDARGYTACFHLPKGLTMTLVAGYNVKLRKAIIDRWQELEAQVAKPALNPANFSRLQLIELAMQAEQERLVIEKEKLALEHKVEELAPKAIALDRIALADGEVCLQTAGKLLQQPPNNFIAWLRSLNTWIFKRPGSKRNSAYTDKINAGYLNVRTTIAVMPDGSERVTEQVVVTPKGLVKLAQMLGVEVGGDVFGEVA